MRIMILAWVEPTEYVVNRIKGEYPAGEINVIKRANIPGSIFRFVRQQYLQGIEVFYFLCDDLEKSRRTDFLLGMSLLFRVKKKKLIDLHGLEQDCSCAVFLCKGLPRILLDLSWSFSVTVFNWIALQLLASRLIMRLVRVAPNNLVTRGKPPIPKRIGFFWSQFPDSNFNFKVGGEISHVVGFFGGLKRLGYEVFMVSSRPILHKQFTAPNEVIDEKGLPAWPGEVMQMAYNWKVLWSVRKLIRLWRPSLIYHRASGFSFIGVLISVFYRLPLIVEINSPQDMAAKTWGYVRFNSVAKQIESLSIMYADKVAVVSNEVRDYLVMQKVPFEKIIINPNGVDPDFFFRDGGGKKITVEYGLSDKTVVGFIGSFNRYHGLLTLARAVRLVVKEIERVHFLIIGDGRLRSDFESIIVSDNVSSYVTLTGKVPHETVPAFLDACDILVSPHENLADGSTFYGSPTKIFEYMAMAKGIVASTVGQLSHILRHEQTALLVRPEDPEDLARAIVRLAQDDVLRQSLGRKARDRVVKSYTWEKNAERIIRPVLGRKGSRE